MAAHALFAGTFDPPTLGHLDLIQRARALFPKLTIGLAEHPTKTAMLDVDERHRLLVACTRALEHVHVQRLSGLTIAAAAAWGCDVLVRGVRSGTDFDYEAQMAGTNRTLAPALDTVLLCTAPSLAHITGTLVRQIATMGGDTRALVPAPVAEALARRVKG